MKKIVIAIMMLVLGFSFMACGKISDDKPNDDSRESVLVKVQTATGEEEVLTYPKKVAVYDYGILDILQNVGVKELGIETLGVPKSHLTNSLSYLNKAEYFNLGAFGTQDVSDEDILFDADIVILTDRALTNKNKFIDQLSSSKIIDLSYNLKGDMNSILDIKRNLETLGKIFPSKLAAFEKMMSDIDAKLAETVAATSKSTERALILTLSGNSLSVFGRSSRFNLIHNEAGVLEADPGLVQKNAHGSTVDLEYFNSENVNPDILFVIDAGAARNNEISTANDLLKTHFIKDTNAAKNNKVILLDHSTWYLSFGGYTQTISMLNEILAVYN